MLVDNISATGSLSRVVFLRPFGYSMNVVSVCMFTKLKAIWHRGFFYGHFYVCFL